MKPDEIVAILISGMCLGWLEKSGLGDLNGQILEAILAIVASTTVLSKSFTREKFDSSAGFWGNLMAAEKSPWPLAILLIGIVVGVLIGITIDIH